MKLSKNFERERNSKNATWAISLELVLRAISKSPEVVLGSTLGWKLITHRTFVSYRRKARATHARTQ